MNIKLLALVLMASLSSSPLWAVELDFNGFFSATGGFVTEDTTYGGYDEDLSFKPDTIIGLQFDAEVTEQLAVTGQIVARGGDDFDAEFEWAYVSYQATDQFKIRMGRIRAPFYMLSDYLEVGYAYPWIRPPREVYSLPFSSLEGIDVIYSFNMGDWDQSLQVYFGAQSSEVSLAPGVSSDLDLDSFGGLVWSIEYESLSMRAGYHRADLTTELAEFVPLFDALNSAGLEHMVEDLAIDEKLAEFLSAGIAYDPGGWFVRAEYTKTLFEKQLLQDSQSWYVLGGVRLGDFTLHLTYADQENDIDEGFSDPIYSDPGFAGNPFLFTILASTIDGIIAGQDGAVNSIIAGVRWDFHTNAAIKMEYSQVEDDFAVIDDFGLFTFGIDVIF